MATALGTENPSNKESVPHPPPTKITGSTAESHINDIVDQISGLTLLQAADLVTALKVRIVVTSRGCSYLIALAVDVLDTVEYSRNRSSCCSSRTGCACRS